MMPTFARALLFIVGAILALFGGGCLILIGSMGPGPGASLGVLAIGWLPLIIGGALIFAAFYRSGGRTDDRE